MLRWFCLLCIVMSRSLSAQTFYEPVEYEYRAGGTLYFYGGIDPGVQVAANELNGNGAAWGRQNGFAFSSASTSTSRTVETEHVRVFTDSFRFGLQDASVIGFTVADARNQAFTRVPRYFQKAQMLRSSPSVEGVRVVPARAGGVTIRKSSGEIISPGARPLMILPKANHSARREAVAQTSVD